MLFLFDDAQERPPSGAPVRSSRFSGLAGDFTTKEAKHAKTVRGGATVRSSRFSGPANAFTTEGTESTEMVGGSPWLDERATEALLRRAGVLCVQQQQKPPGMPLTYHKDPFAHDGWRVVQEHEIGDRSGTGGNIDFGTPIPIVRQFTYGNYLDEALTLDLDTDSDGGLH